MSTISTTYHPGKNDERSIEVDYDFGATLAEFVELFGDGVAYNYCARQGIIGLQAYKRALMGANKTDEEVLAAVAGWKPGMVVERAKKSAKQKALDAIDLVAPEDLADLIKDLKERKANKAAQSAQG